MMIKCIFRFWVFLIIPCLLCTGCAMKKDLADYHQVGETFTASYAEGNDCVYEITVVDHVADSHFTLDLHRVSFDQEGDDVYVYITTPNTDKVVVNGVEYREEIWLPVVYPYGVYEVPLDADDITVQIYFSDDYEDYEGNGYIRANIEAISGGGSHMYYCMRFSAY